MPRKKKASVSQQFEGSFNVKNFEEAINQIEAEHQVPREEIENIIKSSFDKAWRDTLNPFKAEGLEDIRTETIIDEKNGQISTYTLRDVKNEDDIEELISSTQFINFSKLPVIATSDLVTSPK